MLAVIFNPQSDLSPFLRLSNGETVCERQVRILESCGVRQFVCVGALPGQKELLLRHRQTDTRIDFYHDEKDLSEWTHDVAAGALVLQGDLVFSKAAVQRIIGSAEPCATFICRNPEHVCSPLMAQIDMKRVVRIGDLSDRIGCFPHFPFYKLDGQAFEGLIRACGGGAMPLGRAAGGLLDDVKLSFIDCADIPLYISTACPASFDDADRQVRLCDIVTQRVLRSANGIREIREILHQNGVKKPLFVCDGVFQAFPVDEYFRQLHAQCRVFFLSPLPEYGEIAKGVRLFLEEGCDMIVSVGRDGVIGGAKAIKLFCALDPETDFLGQELLYSPVIHMAIPVQARFGSESTRFAAVYKDGRAHVIAHDCALPDYALLDEHMMQTYAPKEQPEGAAGDEAEEDTPLVRLRETMLPCMLKKLYAPHSVLDGANFIGRAANLALDDTAAVLGGVLPDLSFEHALALCLPFVLEFKQGKNLLQQPPEQYRRLLGLKDVCEIGRLLPAIYESLSIPYPPGKDAETLDRLAGEAAGRLPGHAMDEKEIRAVYGRVFRARASVQPLGARKRSRARRLFGRLAKKFRKRLRPVEKALLYAARKSLYTYYHLRHAVNYRIVVFECYAGQEYSCNPRALYEQMQSDARYGDFKYFWAFQKPSAFSHLEKNANTKVVGRHTKAYIKAYARAKYWITNAAIPTYLKPGREQAYIHTWHGKPIKRIGCDVGCKTAGGRGSAENTKIYTALSKKLTMLFSPAPAFDGIMSSAFNLKAVHKEHILAQTGYPRNGFLFRYTEEDVLRVKMRLGVPLNKKVVLYAPTWRPTRYKRGTGYIYHNPLDFARLKEQLGGEYVLLFRAHINEARSVDFSNLSDFMLDVTREPDVNELYIISDILVSDYSGTIFDYANLHRPMVLYMYDREEYTNSLTGVYLDLDELPGKIVYEEAALALAIREQLESFAYDEEYRAFNKKYNCLEGPDCAARALEQCIDLHAPPTDKQRLRSAIRRFMRNFDAQFLGFFRGLGLPPTKAVRLLASYRNKHRGQRCFLIGNGPSLTLEDLGKLRGETCFACNLIYKIFDRTAWRPAYYCVTDTVFTKTVSHEIAAAVDVPVLASNRAYNAMKAKPREAVVVHCANKEPYYVHGNPRQYYVPARATVMSFMIEMAMYMGFSEIYLLGVDCTNSFANAGHFTDEYENQDMMAIEDKRAKRIVAGRYLTIEELGKYRQDRSMFAYSLLRTYADAHGHRIFNATRGGLLEEFERVRFDSLFDEQSNPSEGG